MNANEIRGLSLSATDHNAQMQEQVRDCVIALREVAAQLAEANEHLAKIANPTIMLEEEKPRLIGVEHSNGYFGFVDPDEVCSLSLEREYAPWTSKVALKGGTILSLKGTPSRVADILGISYREK